MVNSGLISLFVLSIPMIGCAPESGSAELPSSCIDAFLGRNMPKNFVYVQILQMVADPRLRGDDEEGFRHVRVGEHPLEGCTRTSPEPAPACAEQSRSKQGRMGEDDDGRDRRCPVKPGMTMEGARVVPLFKTPAKRATLTQRVAQFVLLKAFSQILGEGAF